MSQRQKLIQRFRAKPTDFSWQELRTLLAGFGYVEEKGAGSRRRFVRETTGAFIDVHRPHPGNVVKAYVIRLVLKHLNDEGLL